MWSSTLFLKKLHSDVGSLQVHRRIALFYCVFSFSFCFPVFVIQYSSLHFDCFMQTSFFLVSHHLLMTLYLLACEFHSCFIEVGFLVHCFICSPATFVFECVYKRFWVCSWCCCIQVVFTADYFFFLVSCTEPGIFAHLSCIMIHTYHHYPGILAMRLISFALFIFDPKFHVWFHVCI